MASSSKNFINLSSTELIEHAINNGEGVFSDTGALITNTKKYTGRSPKDKFTVVDDITRDSVWFSDSNKKMAPDAAKKLCEKIKDHLNQKPRYIVDCVAGAIKKHALKIRITTEHAWHALFARNMFLDSEGGTPDFEVFHAPSFLAKPELDATHSEVAIIINFTEHYVAICGSEYAGEIKKSIFTVLNFLLPKKKVLSMHCSANKNDFGDVAIFFGLSGTGKTTLSADPTRSLIGDDEHGWDDESVFNFEGGCYAKVINLSPKDEPEIYFASQQFGTILENVVYNKKTRVVDFKSNRFTENTRASYAISQIPHACLSGFGGSPRQIIMLTCDAFGVLPPISMLNPHAAVYHFINGYTAKVAGTERGIKEPQAVFSACFGAPFMAHFPHVYANLLLEKILRQNVQCFLLNTGWTGGPFGQGSRMKISVTRALLHAALDGQINYENCVEDPVFRLKIPTTLLGIDTALLNPRSTWASPKAYDEQAIKLARLFHENFKAYSSLLPKEVGESGPKVF